MASVAEIQSDLSKKKICELRSQIGIIYFFLTRPKRHHGEPRFEPSTSMEAGSKVRITEVECTAYRPIAGNSFLSFFDKNNMTH